MSEPTASTEELAVMRSTPELPSEENMILEIELTELCIAIQERASLSTNVLQSLKSIVTSPEVGVVFVGYRDDIPMSTLPISSSVPCFI